MSRESEKEEEENGGFSFRSSGGKVPALKTPAMKYSFTYFTYTYILYRLSLNMTRFNSTAIVINILLSIPTSSSSSNQRNLKFENADKVGTIGA